MLIFFNKSLELKAVVVVFLVLVFSICGFVIGFGLINHYLVSQNPPGLEPYTTPQENLPKIESVLTMEKFSGVEEFKALLAERQSLGNYAGGGFGGEIMTATRELAAPMTTEDTVGSFDGVKTESAVPNRVSDTNVQVIGIDEPDIVKTNGQEIFLSSLYRIYNTRPMPLIEDVEVLDAAVEVGAATPEIGRLIPPYYKEPDTKIIQALPVADLALMSSIEASGNLLLSDNTLVILGTDKKISGYDISNADKPEKSWQMSLGDRSDLVDARLKGDEIYLLIAEYANYSLPCPIRPLIMEGASVEIACTDIYYPTVETEIDATYSLISLDAISGEVKDKISFAGSYNRSGDFYVSSDNAYVPYTYSGDMVAFMYNFFVENSDIVPDWVISKLKNLSEYDISNSAKMTELSVIISRWQNSMNEDETLAIENEILNRSEKYYQEHRRELNYTGIVKISLTDMSLDATGAVPGYPLNQFSFDEYNGNLRVATTIGQQGFWMMGGLINSRNHTASDVYVLDDELNIVGQVADLGETERIYSVRFIGDKGYVVTFRQTDPFYVLDLKNPRAPKLAGELKILGYSSYLHPLAENKILGIGKEESYVKLSVFDVSDPGNPKEADKYSLKEYYSEALNNHHAFLLDDKHKVFFMPGAQGGYIFAYEDGLSLKKAVKEDQIQRAVYINDYMYLIGQEKIVVLDENNWERVGELSL